MLQERNDDANTAQERAVYDTRMESDFCGRSSIVVSKYWCNYSTHTIEQFNQSLVFWRSRSLHKVARDLGSGADPGHGTGTGTR